METVPLYTLVPVVALILAALLYLVTEQLLAEAHEVKDTPLVTAMLFFGFLLPLLMRSLG